jgi:peptide/nickel transport system permease protein
MAVAVELSPRARRRRQVRRRFVGRPLAVGGLAVVVLFVLAAILAPILAPGGPAKSDFDAVLSAPSGAHLFGTDDLGRDVFARVVYGARASLAAGVLATLMAMVVAVPFGLISGYFGGVVDTAIMRVTDTLLSFPFLILAVGLAAILGPSLRNAAIAIGVAQVPQLIRITRGEVLSVREEDYVDAAVAAGAPDRVILARHILPNVMSTLLVQATVIVPVAIIGESTLSFLGLGVQPPTPSWGVMLSAAQQYIVTAPWLAIFPGLAIVVATLSFNLLGDGLRDALDPKGTR